jgi:hypothetical protein
MTTLSSFRRSRVLLGHVVTVEAWMLGQMMYLLP